MMKKLLIFMLVLRMASVSQGAWTALVVNGSQTFDALGLGGTTITIDLIADTDWSGCVFGGVVEASVVDGDNQAYDYDVVDMGGAVGSAVIYTSAAVNIIQSGYPINYLGNLFVTASADITSNPIPAGNVTISFDYTLPSTISPGTDYWVAPLAEGLRIFVGPGDSFTVPASYSTLVGVGDVLIEGLHIVPEPATIVLLGLGVLLLRRRR